MCIKYNYREGADLMTNGTRKKIVVSTLAEAEFFASHGFDDIIYGKPVSESQLSRWFYFCNDLYSL